MNNKVCYENSKNIYFTRTNDYGGQYLLIKHSHRKIIYKLAVIFYKALKILFHIRICDTQLKRT